jgi:hypothetical protein
MFNFCDPCITSEITNPNTPQNKKNKKYAGTLQSIWLATQHGESKCPDCAPIPRLKFPTLE